MSPDPLAVHVPGGDDPADLNLYAYVKGLLLRAIDPLGLDVTLLVATQKTKAPRSDDRHRAKLQQKTVRQVMHERVADDRNFVNRAKGLQTRLVSRGWRDVVVAAPSTGRQLLGQMQKASEKEPIKNLVVWGHSSNVNLIMKEDAGLFRNKGDVQKPQEGAAFLADLKERMDAGKIKFSEDATIVLLGCNAAGKRSARGEPFSFAAELAKVTGVRVIASVGTTDQTRAGSMRKEYSSGGWHVFDSESPAGRRLEGAGCSGASCRIMEPAKTIKEPEKNTKED